MQDTINTIGHGLFTCLAFISSNWSEVGAGILMLLQGMVLVCKIRDRYRQKKEIKDG